MLRADLQEERSAAQRQGPAGEGAALNPYVASARPAQAYIRRGGRETTYYSVLRLRRVSHGCRYLCIIKKIV